MSFHNSTRPSRDTIDRIVADLRSEDLAALADGDSYERRLEAFTTHDLTVLAQMAWDPDPIVRRLVARNSETHPRLLWVLSHSIVPAIRRAVAAHSGADDATLWQLLHDEDPTVEEVAHARLVRLSATSAHEPAPRVRRCAAL